MVTKLIPKLVGREIVVRDAIGSITFSVAPVHMVIFGGHTADMLGASDDAARGTPGFL